MEAVLPFFSCWGIEDESKMKDCSFKDNKMKDCSAKFSAPDAHLYQYDVISDTHCQHIWKAKRKKEHDHRRKITKQT